MTSETNDEKKVVETASVPAEADGAPAEPNVAAQDVKEEEVQEVEDKPPKKFLRYSVTESVVRSLIVLALMAFLLFFAYILGMWTSDEGWVPLFNVDLFIVGNLGFLVIIWTAAIVIAEILKSVFGRYNYPLAITTLVSSIVVLVTVSILFFQSNIMNPRFMERLGEAFDGSNIPAFLEFTLGNANVIVVAVVSLILIVETIKVWVKALRYS